MRVLLLAAFFTLLLWSCGDKMQQLETAGSTVKKCINNCSLSTPSVGDSKKRGDTEKVQAVTDDKTGGNNRIQSIWRNHLNMW
ncbi:MAG TPA: hypothetical protein VG738_06760 [Chitinophagaceae bacterium]|nr:hypothetical protein [Chitinophagaceae bacterium]